jgi:16S rRNA (uracil1498-N3)-methyltransferase
MRCFITPSDWTGDEITLSPEESHHLLHVLRARPGQTIEVFNGAGGTGLAEVRAVAGKCVTVAVRERRSVPRPAAQFTLVQALPREQKMDLIVQKATELGAAAIVPVLTEHAVVRLKPDQAAEKQERWTRIVLNAAKQSGVAWLPEVRTPQPLSAFLASRPAFDAFLLGSLAEGAEPVGDVLRRIRGSARTIAFAVGPEGDFSAGEIDAFRAAGAVPVSLGASVLRAETAALYALSVLRYEFGP